jgi:hypothetical protein
MGTMKPEYNREYYLKNKAKWDGYNKAKRCEICNCDVKLMNQHIVTKKHKKNTEQATNEKEMAAKKKEENFTKLGKILEVVKALIEQGELPEIGNLLEINEKNEKII